jgi:DNA polymerase III epsilon subunit-like protein
MKIAFLDHETTGLDPVYGGEESIEIFIQIWDSASGAIPAEQGGTWHRLWMPQGFCGKRAAEVNGFTPEAWATRGAKPMHVTDLMDLNQFLHGHRPDYWGGANTKFDLDFTRATFQRARLPMFDMCHRTYDVQSDALKFQLAGLIKSVSLKALCEFFGVAQPAAHTAQGDVESTIGVFEALIRRQWGSVVGA